MESSKLEYLLDAGDGERSGQGLGRQEGVSSETGDEGRAGAVVAPSAKVEMGVKDLPLTGVEMGEVLGEDVGHFSPLEGCDEEAGFVFFALACGFSIGGTGKILGLGVVGFVDAEPGLVLCIEEVHGSLVLVVDLRSTIGVWCVGVGAQAAVNRRS